MKSYYGIFFFFFSSVFFSCAQQKQPAAADTTNQTSGSNPCANPGEFDPNKLSRNGNRPGGLGAQAGSFYVKLPAPTQYSQVGDTGSTSANFAGFRVSCTNVSAGVQGILNLILNIQRGSPSVTYTSNVAFETYCLDAVTVVASQIEVGDVATLTVNMQDPNGQTYSTGTTASYTQQQVAQPSFTPGEMPSGSGQPSSTGTGNAVQVSITMNASK